MEQDSEIMILVGSPREDGRSAKLAQVIRDILKLRGVRSCLFPLAKYPVAACTGCGSCSATGQCIIAGDSFNVLSKHLDSCSALIVVAPVYFSGPSAWLKAALDRCQVYWARRYRMAMEMPGKRPAYLMVLGEGGDPFGYDPLVTICTSALNSTGLRVTEDTVYDFVGDNFDLERVPGILDQVLGREQQ